VRFPVTIIFGKYMKKIFLFLVITLSLTSFYCGTSVYYVKPPDWANPVRQDSAIKYYSQFLKGWKFYLDPGHGGNDRFNKGPKKDVIEADINLKLGLTLRDYLQRAGAVVYISRDVDTTIDLLDRSKFSNQSGADLFVSIHHNALGNDDHFTNFTSTWYHAVDGDKDYHPVNHDMAKYVQRDLAYVMGNPGSLGSFDGTLSDYTVYPNSGFSVLRNANIPAILIEGSFFSSYYEEQRLKIPEFNEIEAWGVFKGLGKYFRAGIPKLEIIGETSFEIYKPTIKIKATDKNGINSNSIFLKLDNDTIKTEFDKSTGIISFTPASDLTNGKHLLDVIVENKNGNHSFPFKKNINIAPPTATLKMEIYPKQIPPDRDAISLIQVLALDKKGNPVADGTRIKFSITSGSIDYSASTINGKAFVYSKASGQRGYGIITAESGEVRLQDTVRYFGSKSKYILGKISDPEGKPIAGCGVVLPRTETMLFSLPNYIITTEDGKYIISEEFGDSVNLTYLKDGYFGKVVNVNLNNGVNRTDIILEKVANAVLFNKTFVIDPRYGGSEKGGTVGDLNASKVNLEIANYLFNLLKAAGAKVLLTRDSDITISEEERTKITQDIKRGFYIRIDVSKDEKFSVYQYPNISNTNFSRNIIKMLHETTKIDSNDIKSARDGIFSLSGIGTISVSLPSLKSSYFKSNNLKFLESQIAWGIFRGILSHSGMKEGKTVESKIIIDGKPAVGIDAVLDSSLISASDNNGNVKFYNVTGGDGKVTKLVETK
jgi:N-acetylmuramoyl-L-alanine amidase